MIIPILIFFNQEILNLANDSRRGLFLEEFGHYKSISSTQIYDDSYAINNLNLNTIKLFLISFFEFLISPVRDLTSIFKFLLAFENLFLYLFVFKTLFESYKVDKKVFFSWTIIATFGLFMYSIFLFNDAQIHRYKTPIFLFIILGLSLGLQKRKIN